MTDLMEKLARLIKNAPPPAPNEFVKNQSIEKALAHFDKKNASARQGTGAWHRLMDTARTVLHPYDGAFMKKTYLVGGGLCAATLAVAVLNTDTIKSEMEAFKKETHSQQKTGIGFKGGIATPQPSAVAMVTPPAIPAAPVVTPPPIPEAQREYSYDQGRPAAVANRAPVVGAGATPSEPPHLPVASDASSRAVGFRNDNEMAANVGSLAPSIPQASVIPTPVVEKTVTAPKMANFMASAAPVAMGRTVYGSAAGFNGAIAIPATVQPQNRDAFEHANDNPLQVVIEHPVSTFSIDVDTASYSFMRASLNNNVLPQKDAVRIEELVNYFPYDYAVPKEKNAPFSSSVTVMPTPWNKGTKLIHIGIKGYELPQGEKPHSNLVFLIDTSGSMNQPNKLPLLKNSLRLLLDNLQPEDTVAIVTYAGNAGVALEPTKVADKGRILATIESFNAGGSTAGADGIRQAYELAERNFDKKGVNRVILATDGDFNVGITDKNELKSFIEHKRDSGVFLSVLGFGQGNYNDATMQALAQNGNGNAAYIDNLSEARKVLVDEASSTLFTIAKDVKIQVEFNPAKVAEYRLVGYETRMLQREDFNNDKVDAGEIGAGHAVTAIYEITPTDSEAKRVDDLRYGGEPKATKSGEKSNEYAFLKIRYKLPKEDTSKLITTPIDSHVEVGALEKASNDARFATSVAAYGQLLRGETMIQNFTYNDVITLAESAKGADTYGYRAEFINLVRLTQSLNSLEQPSPPALPTRPYSIR